MKHKRVLAYVNRVRKALGYKPRKTLAKGERKERSRCPIAMCIPKELYVDYTKICFNDHFQWKGKKIKRIKHPGYIETFLRNFDRGHYPDLIKKGKP